MSNSKESRKITMADDFNSVSSETGNTSPGYYVPAADVTTQVTEEDFIFLEPTQDSSTQTTEEDLIPVSLTTEASTQTTDEDFNLLTQNIPEISEKRSNPLNDMHSTEDSNTISKPTASNSRANSKEENKRITWTQEFLLEKDSVDPILKTIFVCQKCRRSFKSQSMFDLHLQNHSDPKPYKCDRCHKEYRLECRLKDHYRVHTGEKPFKCEDCSYTTSRNRNLKRHRQMFHSK